MKSFYTRFVGLMIFISLFSCSEEIGRLQTHTFIKYFGTYQADAGNDVATLPGGGYAIIGNMVPDSVQKMTLVITDDAGNQLEGSPYVYGGALKTSGNCILVLSDGYLLGGSITDTAFDGEPETDMYLVRTDESGGEVWSKRYGSIENDDLLDISIRNSGGFVLAGKKSKDEDENLWVLMVDENGDLLFDLQGSDIDDDDEANFIQRTPSGYLVGCTYDDGEMEGTDFYILSLNENCNIIDSKALGTEYDDYTRSIIRYNDGYLIMGFTENELTGLSEVSVYTFVLDGGRIKNTAELATISIAGTDLTGEACKVNSANEIVVFGSRIVNENRDMVLMRIDSAGNLVETPAKYGELGNQIGRGMDTTFDGGLILTGTHTLEGNSLITLIKTDPTGGL